MLIGLRLLAPAVADEIRLVVDSAGRRVRLPAEIHRLVAAGPPAGPLLYALRPDALAGWPEPLAEGAAALLPVHGELPALGRLTGKGGLSLQQVASLRPDAIVDVGDVEPKYASLADSIQAKTGIPYLLLDGHLSGSAALLATLGEALGAKDGGAALSSFAAGEMRTVAAALATVPADHRLSLYYARGDKGLETVTRGSLLGEIFELAGARNVVPAVGGSQIVGVTLDQVRAWDPDVIVTEDPAIYASLAHDPHWASLRALRQKRLYLAPGLPFGWIDEPPGVNRLIGLRWLSGTLYPRTFHDDLDAEATQFFALFYHRAPGKAELAAVLAPP